ncbi:5'/3'-nucleotidase SurE [Agarivorans gilvus]|uniref:5'-nucleotidase n=1 Tax=Agarivorans gilvus TaxID=680279 RepID=A0ABQ1I0U1_9ALTE|nr:5'/3'-nucleotidase SurE [Agarivorans gilvus]GGB01834.1 hypothetical protein GCM10007414_13810 [Agarivorans gilvus]
MKHLSKICLGMALSSTLVFSPIASALNIVLTNDDSWATPNINILKSQLEAAGHDVIMSAPCTGQSGKGGAMTLMKAVPVDKSKAAQQAYCVGQTDATLAFEDYAEGTPVMAVLYGIDVAAAQVWGSAPDLVISGPNEGNNLGYMNNNSGTLGAAMVALSRGVPAIAVSGHMNTANDEAQSQLVAATVVKIVKSLEDNRPEGQALLPAYTGLNVNTPEDMTNHLGIKFTDVGWNGGGHMMAFTDDLGANREMMSYVAQSIMQRTGYDFETSYQIAVAQFTGQPGLAMESGDAGDSSDNSEGVAVSQGYITISTIDGNVQAARGKVALVSQRLVGLE